MTENNWTVLHNPGPLRRIMLQAGFSEVDIHTVVRHWQVESAAWCAGHADLSPAAESRYRVLGPDARGAVRRAVARQLRAQHGDAAFGLAAEAHIAVGIR
jgi:hypothetical protein